MSAVKAPRVRLEPLDVPPLRRGLCDYCGGRLNQNRRRYCSADCRQAYDAVKTSQGKALVDLAKLWRRARYRNEHDAGRLRNDLCKRLDEIAGQDRDRWDGFAKEDAAVTAEKRRSA